MSMTKNDKDEVTKIVTDALNDVMIPALDDMETRLRNDLASKKDVNELKVELKNIKADIDTLDRKFDAQQNRLDRHTKDIEALKSHFAVA